MKNAFFLSRFWPTIVLIFMSTAYITGITYGMTTSGALITAAYVGLFLLAVVAGTMVEYGGRNRIINPITLWTTFFMALAPVGPAVFVPVSPLVFASMLIVVGTFAAAGAIAYLLEHSIVGGRCGTWYIEYGLAPLAVIWAAAFEVGGHRVFAVAVLIFYWSLHFFYKQMPQLLTRAGIKPLRERG